MDAPPILAVSGSDRKKSWNKKLLRIAVDGAREAGGEVFVVDPADYPLPVYSQDLQAEQGMHEHALELQALFIRSRGLMFASPEHNSSVSALLKNMIDWVTRSDTGSTDLSSFKGKVAVLMSASPGGLGGLRGLVHLRSILGNIGTIVLPDQKAVPRAHEAFDEEGRLKDPAVEQAIKGLGSKLVEVTRALHAREGVSP